MQIGEHQQGAVTVLAPKGPLCAADAEQFKTLCVQVIDRNLGRIVVDAAGVPYLDSRGLEVLLDVTEKLGESGKALKLCAACETVREVMELTDLASQFEYYQDVNAAVRSFI
jgi:anti-sigma B factor antagonist